MEKYIALIRELGHFPVISEIKMASRNNPNFPDPNTFVNRLGPKADHPMLVIEHCKRQGYLDVIAICESVPHKVLPLRQSRTAENDGFVYLLKMGKSYKIGRSNDIDRRLREIKIQLPEREEIIHAIRTDDPSGIEEYWHKRFDGKRKRGEWFELNSADIRAFRRRKFM